MRKKQKWDEWFNKASQVRTIEQFKELYDYLFNNENICHTYDSAVHTTSALALAGAWIGAAAEGITGFQASHVKYDFIHQWDRIGNRVGIQIIDYDNLCYPQYVKEFPLKRVSLEFWLAVQRACKENLESLDVNGDKACYTVRQYWGDVCSGIIPDGIEVVEDSGTHCFSMCKIPPICVERPVHTIADMEHGYTDVKSPWYDKSRADAEYERWKKEIEGRCEC